MPAERGVETPFSPERSGRLLARAQAGDPGAREAAVRANLGLVEPGAGARVGGAAPAPGGGVRRYDPGRLRRAAEGPGRLRPAPRRARHDLRGAGYYRRDAPLGAGAASGAPAARARGRAAAG